MTLPNSLKTLQETLDHCAQTHGVPGASVAVFHKGKTHTAQTGVTSTENGTAVTPSTVFNIGSVTKLFTAVQTMQLAEKGEISLDQPVAQHLPGLTNPKITARHILTHTCGLVGDFFMDTGTGDDCLAKYTKACSDLPLAFPEGEVFSYCNSGYSLLGALVQNVRGVTWERSLEETILNPAGIKHWALFPDQKRSTRAMGHFVDPQTGNAAPMPLGPRSMGPGGSQLALSPSDLITFARVFLDKNPAHSDTTILTSASIQTMLEPAVDIPFAYNVRNWGLGWTHFDWGGHQIFGHDGGTAGMVCQLRILPKEDIVIALCSNGPGGGGIFRGIVDGLLQETVGISIPPLPSTRAFSGDPDLYTGSYRRFGMQIDIENQDGNLRALITACDGEANVPEPTYASLEQVNAEMFLARIPGMGVPIDVYFYTPDGSDQPAYLYSMFRALKRLPSKEPSE